MPRQSHPSQLSPTFPQVWIEPVGKPVYNLSISGDSSPIIVPRESTTVPYPHQCIACGQVFCGGEHSRRNWGSMWTDMWTIEVFDEVIHRGPRFIPRSSTRPVDDPTPVHRGKQCSSPVSTGPTTTTTSLPIDGIKNHKVMQQSSPHLPALRSKGDVP